MVRLLPTRPLSLPAPPAVSPGCCRPHAQESHATHHAFRREPCKKRRESVCCCHGPGRGPAPSLALGSSSECLPPLTFYSVLSLVPHHHPCLSPLLHRHSLCTAVGTEPGFVMAKGLFPTVIELHYDLQLRRNTGPLPADNLRVPGVRAQASPFPPPLLRVEFLCLGCCDL